MSPQIWLIVKYLIVLLLFLIVCAIYSILAWITQSYILSVIAILGFFYKIAHTFGLALMFPASFKYYKGGAELSYSKELMRKLSSGLVLIQGMCDQAQANDLTKHNYDLEDAETNLWEYFQLLEKFQNRSQLSKRKSLLLNCISRFFKQYQKKEEGKMSARQYFNRVVYEEQESRRPSFYTFNIVQEMCDAVLSTLTEYHEPSGLVKGFFYQCYDQKLYELRFALDRLDKKYRYSHEQIKTKDGEILEYLILQDILGEANQNHQDNNTVIFCNPNGCFMQFLPLECGYIDFYLRKGLKVCLWNYRGYGYSTGAPTLSVNQQDSLLIYDVLVRKGLNPFLVHGYSIGGPPAIYLASQKSLILIADRTFSCLDEMAKNYGNTLFFLMKIIFYRDRRNYAKLFLQISTKKLIICDCYDEVIHHNFSLKSGVARDFIDSLVLNRNEALSEETSKPFLNGTGQTTELIESIEYKSIRVISKKFLEKFGRIMLTVLSRHDHQPRVLKIVESTLQESIKILANHSSENILKQNDQEEIVDEIPILLNDQINNILGCLDGAGLHFLSTRHQYVHNLNWEEFMIEVQNYVFGLICFGSILFKRKPNNRISLDNLDTNDPRSFTIIKISQIVKALAALEDVCLSKELNLKILAKLRYHLVTINNVIQENLQTNVYRKVGNLLIINGGHNGDLTEQEYITFNEFIGI